MNLVMKFKTHITTDKTYPYGFVLIFALECHDVKTFMDDAYEYAKTLIRDNIVDSYIECLGITQIRNASKYEILELAEQGITTEIKGE